MIDPANADYSNTPVSPGRPRFGYAPADPTVHPHVTIVTPFHNDGATFHETARSVLQQSFQQWEWLIVNDGSTEPESLAVLEYYRTADPRIRVIDHAQNKGPGAARNTGVQAARTEFIAQLDSDDLLEPTAVEKMYWHLESYPEYAFAKGLTVGFGAMHYLGHKGFHSAPLFLDQNQITSNTMIRKTVHQAVGGHDESNRDGLEDWEYWLRCANVGHWGSTIAEYLDWYRRREAHGRDWPNWDGGSRQRAFRRHLRQRYPRLWKEGLPQVQLRRNVLNEVVPDDLPCENRLSKFKPNLLMIVPWFAMGGADRFNLDLVEQLTKRGWTASVATTLKSDHPWLSQFAKHTPDLFCLDRFLRLLDYPRFLRYLIQSRQSDMVMISNSWLGYLLLPYLRAHFPDVVFIDYCHMEQEEWGSGGYPRLSIQLQELLDLNVVSSQHLRDWMIERGGDGKRIAVCYTNVNAGAQQAVQQPQSTIDRQLGLVDKVPIIVYAGRICAQKQPRVLAKTMLRLRKQGIPGVAAVAGSGPQLKWLQSYVKRHRLQSHVRLLGALPNALVKDLMSVADILFLPSQWEGISVSIYEAMASGLPIVGADVGGQRELVTKDCGVLVKRADEDTEAADYASVLAQLLVDPGQRRRMGKAGRQRVETQFRIDQMAETMLRLFSDARELHRKQPRPVPSLGLARTCATQAVEYTWLSEMRQKMLDPNGDPWSRLLYYTFLRSPFRSLSRSLARKALHLTLPTARMVWRGLPLSQTMRERIHPYKR